MFYIIFIQIYIAKKNSNLALDLGPVLLVSHLIAVFQDIVRQKMVDVVIGYLHSICDDVIDVGRFPVFSRTITFRPRWSKNQNVVSQLRFDF